MKIITLSLINHIDPSYERYNVFAYILNFSITVKGDYHRYSLEFCSINLLDKIFCFRLEYKTSAF